MRRMLLRKVQRVRRHFGFSGFIVRLAGVRIRLEAGRIRRRDGDPDAVSLVEHEGRAPKVDFDWIYVPWHERLPFLVTVAERGPADAIGDEDRLAVGIDVAELDGEIGVRAIGGNIEPARDTAGNLQRGLEHVR